MSNSQVFVVQLVRTEIAGLVGDVKFVKAEVEGQKHVSMGPLLFGFPALNFSLSYHLRTVKSYGSEQNRPARISDRFFLGGPMNVRGFNHKGIGPRASPLDGGVPQGDALGGDISYNGTASMGFPVPLPLLAALGLRGQVFANAGNLTTWDRLLDEKKWMKNLADDMRVSVGMGLVWGTRIGRLEANYSWILKAHDHDCKKTTLRPDVKKGLAQYAKMYSGNVTRIYNLEPDPLEHGPPKRVVREEQHIGEIVASSKKRVSWRFTLGDSDRTHEVVLVHSIMSYKKFNGRQIHFSSTARLGDWNCTMILDELNLVMEVRINDMESAEVPKYDFVIDKVPFRRWDVFRRKKYTNTTATCAQLSVSSGNAYGTHRWGPSGPTPSSQNESRLQRGSFAGCLEPVTGSTRGSFTGGSPTTDHTQSFGLQSARSSTSLEQSDGHVRSSFGQQNEQLGSSSVQQYGGKRSSLQDQRQLHPATAAPKPKKQPEINLIDDFGPTISVSAQSLIFDPLASILLTGDSAATNVPQQEQPKQDRHQYQAPPIGAVSQPATYADPFASVATPVMVKPAGHINLDPFANPNASKTYQQIQQPTRQMPRYQQPMMGMPSGAAMRGMALQQQSEVQSSVTGQQPAFSGMSNVNYSISQLMDPASLMDRASLQKDQDQQGKSINIDAFAGLGH
ncbi:hypothetical protein DD237_000069 [Peronospora effusa]|uniref:Bacterial surface antigen (D15) domain-containing protein n=1 Tax=Peronospora effusa TaxID=542832 RepID=A0A3R7WUK2_9STRA|nr:hypothetical protein DD237_000069 [Peronospora effusa]